MIGHGVWAVYSAVALAFGRLIARDFRATRDHPSARKDVIVAAVLVVAGLGFAALLIWALT